MAKPLLGCIADDFTGATDLANILVRSGMRVILSIGIPTDGHLIEADALIVALKSRTVPADDAVAQSLSALNWLRLQGCTKFEFKYCSTFDSTDAGNIGPVIDALLFALNEDFTIACPALPENGRTVFRGHLFVGNTLVNESGMQSHPLTPMTDPNLVRVLQRQTRSSVGLISYDIVGGGVETVRKRIARLRGDGIRIAIVDAASDSDLRTIGSACEDLKLLTGGSGIALGLANEFLGRDSARYVTGAGTRPVIDGRAVVLSGSASKATNEQVTEWCKTRPGFKIDPLALARGEYVTEAALAFAQARKDETVLIYGTSTPDEVKAVQERIGTERAGQLVEQALSSIAAALHGLGVRKFIVAGGETSGAVVQALDIEFLQVGDQIDPGVPLAYSIGGTPIAIALKSGNFGNVDFFAKALKKLGSDE